MKDDLASGVLDELGILVGNIFVVHDSGGGNVQGADALAMGFELAKLVAIEQAQAGDAVGDAALVQLREARNFFGSGGHNQLAALFVRNAVLGAEALHRGASGDAVARLERAGAVVEAGVDDAGVVSGLMGGDAVFFLDDDEALAGEAAGVFERGSEPNDARADDEEVGLAVGHKSVPGGTNHYRERRPQAM